MTEHLDVDSTSAGSTRRSMLRAAGLAVLAGGGTAAFAGCSPVSDTVTPAAPAQGTASSARPAPSSAAPSSASASASAKATPTSEATPTSRATPTTKAPAGTVIAKTAVPQGGGVILKNKYVVTQPAAGKFKAFTAICTHAGCPVKQVEEQQIKCPCHGSRFSITDGSPIGGPAKAPLAPVKLVHFGNDLVIPD